MARKGGKAAGAKKRAAAARQWDIEARDMAPGQIAKAFYRRGYNNSQAAAERRGFAKGYEAALKDLRLGRSA